MANKKMARSAQILTPKFRVSYPAVFEPRSFEGQKPKYSVVMLFDITDPKVKKGIDDMKRVALKVFQEQWGPDKTKWPKGLRSPFRLGTEPEKADKDGYGEGIVFVSSHSGQIRPQVVDRQKNPILDPNDFYGGCYAWATGNFYAYDKMGNKGVAFGLGNIQKLADGEPFSGRTKAEDDFSTIDEPEDEGAGAGAEQSQEADPMAGLI